MLRLPAVDAARRAVPLLIGRCTAAVLALVAGLPGSAAAQLLPPVCGWYEPPVALAYPEANARYYQIDLPARPPAGARVRVEGEFLGTRYFSLQTYDARFDPVDHLADYRLRADPGSRSTLLGPTASNPAIRPGGRYTAYVEYGAPPRQRPRNTLYTGTRIDAPVRARLWLRAYLPETRVPLPVVVLETPDGDRPLFAPDACRPPLRPAGGDAAAADAHVDATAAMADAVPAPTTAADFVATAGSSPRVRRFEVFHDIGDDGEANSQFGLNQDAAYMALAVRRSDDVLLVQGRAPTFRDRFIAVPLRPEVRYWSFCQNDEQRTTVVACAADRSIPVDAAGRYHLALGDGLPALPLRARGFAALPFGTVRDGRGLLIYRQLIAAVDFAGAIQRVGSGQDARAVIGDYAPIAVSCPRTLFSARVRAGDTPASIIASCAAAP